MEKDNRIERCWLFGFWLASAGALAGALISQYGFAMKPCHLCLYQRVPYSLALLLLTPLFFYRQVANLRLVYVALALLFLANAGVAGYHTGVEQKWWAGPGECSAGMVADTLEALKAEIMGATFVRCDEPAFLFLGLSMAAWNFLYSLTLAGGALWRLRQPGGGTQ